jgi:hypothetical protein
MGRNIYIPSSFICLTGVPGFIYLNPVIYILYRDRIKLGNGGVRYMLINGEEMLVKRSIEPYNDVNIIGLQALGHFKLTLDSYGVFSFGNLPEYF